MNNNKVVKFDYNFDIVSENFFINKHLHFWLGVIAAGWEE